MRGKYFTFCQGPQVIRIADCVGGILVAFASCRPMQWQLAIQVFDAVRTPKLRALISTIFVAIGWPNDAKWLDT